MNVPNMERRHFQFVADILANLDRDEFTHNQQIQLANLFADNFQTSNVNFDRDRFLKACDVLHGTIIKHA